MEIHASQQRARRGTHVPRMPLIAQYGITLLGVAMIAGVVGVLSRDGVQIENPGTPFVIVVVGAVVAFGVRPALAAIASSFLVIGLFFRAQENPQRLVVLLVTLILIVVLAEGQRRARERAERARANLRAILESMGDAVIFVDATGRPEDLNHAARALLSAPDRNAALTAMAMDSSETVWADEHALLQRALTGETDVRGEVTVPLTDETPRILSVAANSVRDAAGRIIGAVSVSRDITDSMHHVAEREELLRQVAEQAAQLEASFAATVDGIAIYDAEGKTLRRNAANYRMLGLDPDYDWDRFDIVAHVNMRYPDGRPMPPEELHTSRALRGETVNGEVLLITDSAGHDRYLRQNAAPIRAADNTIFGAVLVTNDITEERTLSEERERLLKRVEEQAAELEATFGAMLEGITVYDTTGRIIHRNAAYYDLLRLDVQQDWERDRVFAAMHFRNADGTPVSWKETATTAALRGETVRDAVILATDGSGQDRYFQQNAAPIRGSDGTVIGAVIVFHDVSEQMQQAHEREALLSLVEERRKFAQTIFDSVPVGLAVLDVQTLQYQAVNPAYIAAAPAPYHGRDFFGATLPDVFPGMRDTDLIVHLREVAETGIAHADHALMFVHPERGPTYWDEMMVPLSTDAADRRFVLLQQADVTEQLAAQQHIAALAATAANRAGQFEAVFASIAEGLLLVEPTGGISRWNVAAEYILALGDEPLTTVAAFYERFDIRDEDGTWLAPEQRITLKTVTDRDSPVPAFVRQFRNGRGELRWMRLSVASIRDLSGNVTGAVVTFVDITHERQEAKERTRLLRELAGREEFARAIFSSVPEGLMVVSVHDGTVRMANAAFARLVGEDLTPESLTGKPAAAILPQGTTDSVAAISAWYQAELPRITMTRQPIVMRESAFMHPTRGETFWDITWTPLLEGGDGMHDVLTVVADVTEQTRNRHHVEELAAAAAQRAAELETIISSMPDGIAIGSAEGRVSQLNAAARRILGSDTLIGQNYQELAQSFTVRHPDGMPVDVDELPLARAARGETFSGQEILIATANGEAFVSCGGAPIRGATGEITGTVVVWSDITERKRTEGLMTRLGRIVDASSNEVYILDAPTYRIVQANEGAQRNLGYSHTEITAYTLLDIAPGLSEDTLEMLVAPLRDNEETEVVYELQFARTDGTMYPVEMQLYLSRAEISPVFVAIVQDITERHTAIRQRETLFREIDERRRFAQTVIESAPAGIAVFAADDDFTVRIANEQYTQLFDEPWRSRGVEGRTIREFMPDAETTGMLTIYRQVRDSGESVFLREFEYGGSDRGATYFDWSLVPLREDGIHITGLVLLITDVTERVRSRQRIEELAWDAAQRANELETILASITDGVIVTDAVGHVTLGNVASQRLLGEDRVAVLVGAGGEGRNPQSVFADAMPLARAMQGETIEDQVLLVRAPGVEAERYLLCSSAPVRATDGVITGAVAVFRDITAIKQVEQLKDEFISVAAHELRTPLTAIKGYAELLERRLHHDPQRTREQQSLAVIRKQTDRLARLVNEMLDVSRIEAGRLQLNREHFDLSALVEETMNNMRVSSDLHTFVLDATPEIEAFADTARVEQVLINLIANAVTYSPQGGTITVRVRVRVEDGQVVVSVRDQGIGIAPEEAPQLFSRFYRSPQAGVMRSGGMGLGLYISREIVERHNGTISVESVPGVGSTFTFTLPLAVEHHEGEEQ